MKGLCRIRIVVQRKVCEGVQNRAGTLGRGGAVEVDQAVAVDPFSQHRELGAQGFQFRSCWHSYRSLTQRHTFVSPQNGSRRGERGDT